MDKVTKAAVKNALATVIYIALIGSFLYYAPKIFPGPDPDTALLPITMLLLVVLSAAITGFLIFGGPVRWYLDGKKKEALSLITRTLLVFFGITLVSLITLFLSFRG